MMKAAFHRIDLQEDKMNPLASMRPAAPPLRQPRLPAGWRPFIFLIFPLIALMLGPVRLGAQAEAFAGPWNDVGKIQYLITVTGNQLISDQMLSGARHVIKAEITGQRTAKGTWTSTSGDRIISDYNIEMAVSADGREMSIMATRINYGLREFRYLLTRPWDWKAKAESGPILTCTYKLGHELPLQPTEGKPVALRFNIRLNDTYWPRYSIAQATFGGRNPEPGQSAVVMDDWDGFYIYAEGFDDLLCTAPAGAKELVFDVAKVNFGNKPVLHLPKSLTAHLWVTLVGDGAKRVEQLEVPIRITDLFTVETIRCRADGMPTFKGARLPKAQPLKGRSGDELVISPDAGVQVQFLDGTAVVYFNRDDVKWTLTMAAGKFTSTDSSRFLSNRYEINALIDQSLAGGVESASDKAAEKGLEILMRKVASHSAAGLVVQISQFFGSSRLGGEKVAVRLRSRVGVSLNRGGRIVVRNFEGAPEILRPGKPALEIPVGFQAVVERGGRVRPPEPFPAGHPAVRIWSGDGVSPQPVVAGAQPEKKQPAVANAMFAGAWHGTWSNNLGEKGADSLALTEGANGNLSGTWSGTILVSGRRTGPGSLTLQGGTSTRSYRISGTLRGNILSLRYIVTRLDMGGTYQGESTLTRN
jgi:hypothetical protein